MNRRSRTHITFSILTALTVLLLQPALGVAEDTQKIHLASDYWPPFTAESGQRRVALELVHMALDRAGFNADTQILAWKDVHTGLRNGEVDGCAAMWRSADRESFLLYSQPYLENRLVLIGRKGSDVSAVGLSDLAGKQVAAVTNYAYGIDVEKAKGVHFIGGRSDQHNLEKLLRGEVEYMLVDEFVARHLMEHQAEEASKFLEIGVLPMTKRTLHFVVRKDYPHAEALIKKFNAEISKMMVDGTYNDVLELDWIRADIDGDGQMELVAKTDEVGETLPKSTFSILGTDRKTGLSTASNRIVIGGKVYEGWEAVPREFKVPPSIMSPSQSQGEEIFKFKF
ncbi:MAG: transporter substrate-binding domain-containing protein [bacterium]|nr:transporter substrate-binding domain-containing protein [bacterium]